MNIDLSSVGMVKGQQYETIITTADSNQNRNTAPIGVICRGKDSIMCRIFKGGRTLDNIINQKEFTVNLTSNPQMFTSAIINNIPEEYLTENNSLVGADSYFKCEVTDLIEAVKKSDPIRKSEAIVIKAKVTDLKINNPYKKAINRGFFMLIETLSDFTRIDLVDVPTQQKYITRFKECMRVINKVGSKEDKKAIHILKNELIKKGFEI